jgi:hypothetical protein
MIAGFFCFFIVRSPMNHLPRTPMGAWYGTPLECQGK